jgi:N-glycosylase/DNA lyase
MTRYSVKKIDDEIRKVHREIAARAEERLAEFRRIWESGDDTALFAELAFCLLTPQSGARRCAQAVELLKRSGNLFHGGFDDICPDLNIVRFKNNKTRYLIEAREKFWSGGGSLRKFLGECGDARSMRKALVESVRGIGYKEASHFLRNIGLGEELAILDRHVLRVMARLDLLGGVSVGTGGSGRVAIPRSISGSRYIDLEVRLGKYAARAGVPMGHLDFVLFFMATGDIFK